MSEDIELEQTASRGRIAGLFRAVADGIGAGRLRVGDGDAAADVDVPEETDFELELETVGDHVELDLEVDLPAEAVAPAEGEAPETAAGADQPAGPVGAARDAAEFELYRDKADEWRWRLRHSNGNVIADSGEGYTRKQDAKNGLRSVARNASGAEVVELED